MNERSCLGAPSATWLPLSAPYLAHAATTSARLNQHILPKPQLDDLIAIAEEQKDLGVCCATAERSWGYLTGREQGREQRLRRAVTEV